MTTDRELVPASAFRRDEKWSDSWPPDKRDVAVKILETLFATYPQSVPVLGWSGEECRKRALAYASSGQCDLAFYWACDTGVPNDLVVSTFRLLNPYG